jgi:hypothetical protein
MRSEVIKTTTTQHTAPAINPQAMLITNTQAILAVTTVSRKQKKATPTQMKQSRFAIVRSRVARAMLPPSIPIFYQPSLDFLSMRGARGGRMRLPARQTSTATAPALPMNGAARSLGLEPCS